MTVIHGRLADTPSYITLDGSRIRELMHPGVHGNTMQSLAEANVQPGCSTLPHRHIESEEIYHILAGTGRMTLDDETFDIAPGDTILIPPGTPHCLLNTGKGSLRLLCCSSPPYRHEDTEILGQG